MGFSGGGSNILKSHKHTSNVQDGGKLDMDNVTEAELTQGDVIFSDGNALQRLAIGAATNSLVVNGAATAPEWAAGGSSPVITTQEVFCTNGSTFTSATLVDIPNSTIVLPTRAGGSAFLSACMMFNNSAANNNIKLAIDIAGVTTSVATLRIFDASNEHAVTLTAMCPLSGQTVKLQTAINSGTGTVINIPLNTSSFQSFEVS